MPPLRRGTRNAQRRGTGPAEAMSLATILALEGKHRPVDRTYGSKVDPYDHGAAGPMKHGGHAKTFGSTSRRRPTRRITRSDAGRHHRPGWTEARENLDLLAVQLDTARMGWMSFLSSINLVRQTLSTGGSHSWPVRSCSAPSPNPRGFPRGSR